MVTHLFSPSYGKQRVGEDHPPEYLTIYICIGDYIKIVVVVLCLVNLFFYRKYWDKLACANTGKQKQTLYHLIMLEAQPLRDI